MKSYQNLRAWQASMLLVEEIYRLTKLFPDAERFGLISQIRRAAVSVPSNIAEGVARGSLADYMRFLYIARGSLSELDTQLQLAERLGYCQLTQTQQDLITNTFTQLGGLIKYLRTKTKNGTR